MTLPSSPWGRTQRCAQESHPREPGRGAVQPGRHVPPDLGLCACILKFLILFEQTVHTFILHWTLRVT